MDASGVPDLHCTCYRLRKTTRRVTAVYDEALAPLGLTVTQMNILAMIATHGPRAMSTLADDLGMDASTVSRTLRPMLSRGLLDLASGEDRRVRQVRMTADGAALAGEALPLWRAAQRRVERLLGGDVARLHDLLSRLHKSLD